MITDTKNTIGYLGPTSGIRSRRVLEGPEQAVALAMQPSVVEARRMNGPYCPACGHDLSDEFPNPLTTGTWQVECECGARCTLIWESPVTPAQTSVEAPSGTRRRAARRS